MKNVAVIGGGPAGMIAAAQAVCSGCSVTILERNEKLGKKLFLTGKGRCNITNDAAIEDFFKNVLRNPKFLYSAFYSFDNNAIIRLIEDYGVKTKVERGGRVFPESDKSSDVIRALSAYVKKSGAFVELNSHVSSVISDGEGFAVTVNGKKRHFDAVILATGGKSYPTTGSNGEGYNIAESLGHSIKPPIPSLIPLVTYEKWPCELQGLSLKNVTLTVEYKKRKICSEPGEMLFTHFGVSGPLVLSASALIALSPENTKLYIDMKPGLSIEQLDKRILSDINKFSRKQFKNSLHDLLPQRMIPVIVELSGISPEKLVDDITREERLNLVHTLKAVPLTVKCTRPIDEAIITCGGVSVKEVNPSTMESKLVSNLFFAGEMLDLDAQTGGYNLQIAYSTGYLAGNSVKERFSI